MKFGTMTQRTYGQNFEFLKSQDGCGCHLKNHKNRDISATVSPTITKFGKMTQNWSDNRSDR